MSEKASPQLSKREQRITDYIAAHGSITALDSFLEFGDMRLATGIFQLRRKGYAVTTTIVKDTNRHGEPMKYARYTMPQSNAQIPDPFEEVKQ